MCAGTCIRAVGGCGRSAPLRVQGHADCGHVRGVKLLGRATRAVFARPRRRVRAMQAHHETNTRIFFFYAMNPVIQLHASQQKKEIIFSKIQFFS